MDDSSKRSDLASQVFKLLFIRRILRLAFKVLYQGIQFINIGLNCLFMCLNISKFFQQFQVKWRIPFTIAFGKESDFFLGIIIKTIFSICTCVKRHNKSTNQF